MNVRLCLRFLLAVVLSLSVAYVLLVVLVRVHESAVRSRSEAMYTEFLKLQIGETSKADVEKLLKRFAGSLTESVECKDTDCLYTIGDVWGYSRWFLLTRYAHDHMPSSQLTFKTSGSLLSNASFTVGVTVPKGYGTREERMRLSDPNYVPYSSGRYWLFGRASLVSALPEGCCGSREYRISGPSGCTNCLAIWVSALPTLAPDKRRQVFDINFDCMTRWPLCTDKEDIMPTAGREKAAEIPSAY